MAAGVIGLVFAGRCSAMAAAAPSRDARPGSGTHHHAGVSPGFVHELSGNLAPGSAALVVLVRELSLEKVLACIHQPGHVMSTRSTPGSRHSSTRR